MLQAGAKYVWDEEMKVPYMVDGDQWVGFDDERAIRNKMQWLKSEGYAGAMVWTLDMDDFKGTVCGGNGKYPLITAMREELNKVPRSPPYKVNTCSTHVFIGLFRFLRKILLAYKIFMKLWK
jgi:chitinase